MHTLVELIHDASGLPASSAIFLVCVGALAVVWKALDVVAKSQGKKGSRRDP